MPFTIDTTSPADNQIIAQFPATERTHRTNVSGMYEIEHEVASGRHQLGSGSTTARNAISDWPVGSVWFNTDWNGWERRTSTPDWRPFGQFAAGTTAHRVAIDTQVGAGNLVVANNFLFFETDTGHVYEWDTTLGEFVKLPYYGRNEYVSRQQLKAPVAFGAETDVLISAALTVPEDGADYGFHVHGSAWMTLDTSGSARLATLAVYLQVDSGGWGSAVWSGSYREHAGNVGDGTVGFDLWLPNDAGGDPEAATPGSVYECKITADATSGTGTVNTNGCNLNVEMHRI